MRTVDAAVSGRPRAAEWTAPDDAAHEATTAARVRRALECSTRRRRRSARRATPSPPVRRASVSSPAMPCASRSLAVIGIEGRKYPSRPAARVARRAAHTRQARTGGGQHRRARQGARMHTALGTRTPRARAHLVRAPCRTRSTHTHTHTHTCARLRARAHAHRDAHDDALHPRSRTCRAVARDLPDPAEAQDVVDAVRAEILRQVRQPPVPPGVCARARGQHDGKRSACAHARAREATAARHARACETGARVCETTTGSAHACVCDRRGVGGMGTRQDLPAGAPCTARPVAG
jgi:hypothetical protein